MLAKTYIRKNLVTLNGKFNRSQTLLEPMIYAKLAIIELCGWIEISIDEIIEKHRDSYLNSNTHITKITKNIENNYGFHSTKHLKKLLADLVGYHGIEELEAMCNQSKIQNLYRELNELTTIRNSLAHTYIKGQTNQIDAPSKTISRFYNIHDGFKEIDAKLTLLR
jgi:hypothetical protein